MQTGDSRGVSSKVDELINFQTQTGDPGFCCMSLCDLAIVAQRQSLFTVQEMLTARAVRLKPDDAWTQHGKSLLNVGELSNALEAYDSALEFGGDVVAQNGRAEVLKAQGQLGEALSAYDAVRRQHPENVVAICGRASLLVLMQRWEAALAELDLAEQGRGADWIAQHIRAVVYLRTKRRDAARSILSNGAVNCPESEQRDYFRATLAQMMVAEGELESARELAEQLTYSRFDKTKNVLLTHILEKEQKLDEAREIYERLPEPTCDDDAEVCQELQRRVTGLEPRQSNEWIQNQLYRLVLTA